MFLILYNNHDLKIRCCCLKFNGLNTNNCSEICADTKFCNVFISFPCKEKNKVLHQEYLYQLGLKEASKYDVVCGSHFLDDDFVCDGSRNKLVKITSSTTNYSMQTGVDSRRLPPIPYRSIDEVRGSKRLGFGKDGLPTYPQLLKDKRIGYLRRGMTKQKVEVLVKAYRSTRKNSVKNKTSSYYVGSTKHLFDLVNDIHYHSKRCRGAITIPSRSITTKDLAQKVRTICKCGRGCQVWGDSGTSNNGSYIFESDEFIKVPSKTDENKFYEDYAINFKQAVASISTPASRKTVRQVLQGLQLGSISIKKERNYHRNIIHQNIKETYSEVVAEKFKVLEKDNYITVQLLAQFKSKH